MIRGRETLANSIYLLSVYLVAEGGPIGKYAVYGGSQHATIMEKGLLGHRCTRYIIWNGNGRKSERNGRFESGGSTDERVQIE